ncbi:Dnaj heat shock n-terminal domain-containing protein [Thalictrum thalictroides]|uniref:Dnaj heat shock n-terminal domain-containing protein n=1 Tax=Thalictrum thalictroides TaxID=46969 RepID=A0A7J6X5Q0_THATH|nr:Dnaj heat shock n-terminal domain-containing protein [Thalictrum thalictroides]
MERKQAALRALEEQKLAETLIKKEDYKGASLKLSQARKIYPLLENLDAMTNVCNILNVSHNLTSNKSTTDWYMVLRTDPKADDSLIVSKYRKLVKSFEPIKNNFPGTEFALGVLREAFSVLSDKKKRLVFDLERFNNLNMVSLANKSPSSQLGSSRLENITRGSGAAEREILQVSNLGYGASCGNDLEVVKNLACKKKLVFEAKYCDFNSGRKPECQTLNAEQVEICPKEGEVWAVFENWRPFDWCEAPQTRKGCGYLYVEIVLEYSKSVDITVALLEKVAGFQSIFRRCMNAGGGSTFTILARHMLKFSHNVPAYRFRGGEIDNVSAGMLELDPLVVPFDPVQGMGKPVEGRTSFDSSSIGKGGPIALFLNSEPEITSMCKWSRKDFATDQVWAVYDGPDSMPRRYVVVNNVVSGIEVCATFLDPYPTLDEEKQWVEEGLPFVCGLFRPRRNTMNLSMSQFSHVVSCEMSTKKSFYRIYPEKGEVWAVYENWHPKWKNGDYESHRCQITEVLSDFSEGAEMKVASLVEMNGYMTFFQRQQVNDYDLTRTITRIKMLSFSHQIPCFDVEGSLHLEPDALPPKR